MIYQLYQRHPVSGELYVFEREGNMLIGICGPIEYREATSHNLGLFNCDTEDLDWAEEEGTRLGGWRSVYEPYPGDQDDPISTGYTDDF